MPACASEGCTPGARFRSSSPPNSRSNSASPPLSWPAVPGPDNKPSQLLFKRSVSNLSNSSLPSPGNIPEHIDPLSTSSSSPPSASHYQPKPTETLHAAQCQHHGAQSQQSWRIFRKPRNDSSAISSDPGGGGGSTNLNEGNRNNNNNNNNKSALFFPARLMSWYAGLVITALRRFRETLSYVVWAPIIWLSAWICVFWVLVQLPLHTLKWLLLAVFSTASERARAKRCVLISGGSTLQALHLARNFHKAGARVVVCEIDGLFGLARFSTACARFYVVPRPAAGAAAEYVAALRRIVRSENAVYYVPVSSTVDAYYDALAKPHLEILGCECFVPGTAEVTALEDPLRLIQRCAAAGLATPAHHVVTSPADVERLYEAGVFAGGADHRYTLLPAGPVGMRERAKLRLPAAPAEAPAAVPRDLRRRLDVHEMSERRPWLVMQELPTRTTRGTAPRELVTCTTVKDSRVVANVTCRVDEARGLVPEERPDVDQWLEAFFLRPFDARINGHMSFRLVCAEDAQPRQQHQQRLYAIGCRVGVPLPYLCLTSVHPRLVWRPCRHFSRQNSASALVSDRYKGGGGGASMCPSASTRIRAGGATCGAMGSSGGRSNGQRVVSRTNALDKRDALFVYWDPLPYCAYYHLQLPFRRLAGAIRERPAQHKPPLAVVR